MRFFNKCLYLFIMICTMSCLSHTGQSDVGNKIVVEDLFISNILKAREFKLPLNMIIRNSRGDTVNLELDYVNIYDQPLIIKQVDFSCDCVAVEYSKCELDSRLNDKLLVKFIPDRTGERIIQLRGWHNQSPVPEELTLYSNISD